MMDYFTIILLICIILIIASIIISIGIYRVKMIQSKFENLNEADISERLSLNDKLKAKIIKINQKLKPTKAESQLRKLYQKLTNKSNKFVSDEQELVRSVDNSFDCKNSP